MMTYFLVLFWSILSIITRKDSDMDVRISYLIFFSAPLFCISPAFAI
jgi:hypothetical protein